MKDEEIGEEEFVEELNSPTPLFLPFGRLPLYQGIALFTRNNLLFTCPI
jgi:hypothetical protein